MRTSTAEANGYRCPQCGDEVTKDPAGKGFVRPCAILTAVSNAVSATPSEQLVLSRAAFRPSHGRS